MGIFEIFVKGGLVMYPLLICSILVAAIAIERMMYLRKMKTASPTFMTDLDTHLKSGDLDGARSLCQHTDGVVPALIAGGLTATTDKDKLEQVFESGATIAASRLRYRVGMLDMIVTLSPLLGLLGTVIGMIQSFSVFNLKSGEPMAITGGIGEALIATATGLCVAIFALVVYTILNHKIDALIDQMENAANAVILAAMERK